MLKNIFKQLIAVLIKTLELIEESICESDLHKAKLLRSSEVLDSLLPAIIWQKNDDGNGVDKTKGLTIRSFVTTTEDNSFGVS